MVGFLSGIAGGATVAITIKAVDKFSGTFKSAGAGLKALKIGALAAVAGVAALGVGLTKLGISATKAASNAEEIFTKFDAVFSDVGKKSEEVAKDLRDNFGLATSSAKELLSGTGDLLTGFGFTGDEALTMAEKIAKLSVDLASFQNLQGGATQATNILNKALLGERESLTTLGVKILESDVQARLAAEGQNELTGTALLQAKALVTLQLVTEQTGKAQGDFARTQEGFANQSRILSERFKELKERLGAEFLPAATKLVKLITTKLIPAIEPLIPLLGKFFTGALEFAANLLNDLTSESGELASVIRDDVKPFIMEIIPVIKDWAKQTFVLFKEFREKLIPVMKSWIPLGREIFGIIKALMPPIMLLVGGILLWSVSIQRTLIPVLTFLVKWLKIFLIPPLFVITETFRFLISLVEKASKVLKRFFGIRDKGSSKGDKLTVSAPTNTSNAIESNNDVIKLNDFILKPNGQIIQPSPQDTIIGTKGGVGNTFIFNIERIQGVDPTDMMEAFQEELSKKISI